MSLTPNFELTPRNSYFNAAADNRAYLFVRGVTIGPNYSSGSRHSLESQYLNDEVYFYPYQAADPSVNFSVWDNRIRSPHVELQFNLSTFGSQKELALVFGFDALYESRLLIYSSAALLADETLAVGDNQFLMEIEALDSWVSLFFINVHRSGMSIGGSWFFRGITGYVI